jgi:sulfite reductase subunit B
MRIYTPNIGRIRKIKKETKDTKTFQIELEDKLLKENFYFQPGEFALISVFNVGEAPFSFSSSPFKKYFEITVRKVGNVTNALFNLRENDYVGVRGPYGKGYPMDEFEGKNIILISGGCGLAPLKSVIEYVLDKREKYGKIILLYGAKTPSDILYKREIANWKKKENFNIYLTVDKGTKSWSGEIGVVTKLIDKIKDFKNSVFCICGPPIMIKFTILSLKEKKVEEEDIFVSLERKMQCGIGLCCHCNINNVYICKEGPVFRYYDIKDLSELGW